MLRGKVFPIYPEEARMLKTKVYDFSEIAAKQALYGMIKFFTFRTSITQAHLREILDDASKYSQAKKQP